MKAYERYKDSCVAWLGKIPKYWELPKLRKIFIERSTKVSDKDYPALSVGYMGVVPQLETAAKTNDGDNRKLICKGDFAINSRSDRKGAGGISEYNGSASNIIIVLKPYENINGKFYHYLLRSHYFSEEFYRNGHGIVSDLWTTGWDTMRNIFIPLPPLSEQNQIAKFLDEKISKLNKLISIRQQEISELRELKKAIINKAVTKGDWKRVRLGNCCQIIMGQSPKGESVNEIDGIEFHQGKIFFSDRFIQDSRIRTSNPTKIAPANSVLLSVRAPVGKVNITDREICIGRGIAAIKTSSEMPTLFLFFLLQTLEDIFNSKATGSTFKAINIEKIYNQLIPLPPLAEQNEIADYLDKKCSQIDALITNHEKQITELNELKDRLISDAVTGKIDVR